MEGIIEKFIRLGKATSKNPRQNYYGKKIIKWGDRQTLEFMVKDMEKDLERIRERRRIAGKEWRKQNPDKFKQSVEKWREKSRRKKEKKKEYAREYYKKNREDINQKQIYYKAKQRLEKEGLL